MVDDVEVHGRYSPTAVCIDWTHDGEEWCAWIDQTTHEPYLRKVRHVSSGRDMPIGHGFAEAVEIIKREGLISVYRLREETTSELWERLASLTADHREAARIVDVLRARSHP